MLMADNHFFAIPAKLFIERHEGVVPKGFRQDLGDRPSDAERMDYGYGQVVLPFNHDIVTLLEIGPLRRSKRLLLAAARVRGKATCFHSLIDTRVESSVVESLRYAAFEASKNRSEDAARYLVPCDTL